MPATASTQTPDSITFEEAAELLNVKKESVASYMYRDDIPLVKAGPGRVTVASLEKYMATRSEAHAARGRMSGPRSRKRKVVSTSTSERKVVKPKTPKTSTEFKEQHEDLHLTGKHLGRLEMCVAMLQDPKHRALAEEALLAIEMQLVDAGRLPS